MYRLLILLPLFLAACGGHHKHIQKVDHLIAVLAPTEGNKVMGAVHFHRTEHGFKVVANLTGLTPGKHGFHIHQYGDVSGKNGKTTGGHYNPGGHNHAGPKASVRHVGDMGNLTADKNGNAHLELEMIDPCFYAIIGRGVIVHAGEDDLKSQPTGAAGPRVASGVIGIAK